MAITAVLLAGCVADPPPPEDIRKQALGELALEHPWKAGVPAEGAVQDNWLAGFGDATLDALVREALVANPDLRVAGARMRQAAELLVQARAPLFPWLGVAGTGGFKASGGGADPSSALQGIVAAASWELDLWGRVRYARNAAAEDNVSAQADYEFARQSIAAGVARAWFTAIQLSEQARLTAQMVASSNQLANLAADRERVGAGSVVDTANARADAYNLEDALAQTEYARDQALRALELLLGRYPAAEIATRTDFVAMPPAPPVGVPLAMLERRPDVIAAERRVAAAFNRIGQAKAAMLPQITLNLNFGAFESDILELREDFENPSGGAGARLLAPIYTGGSVARQCQDPQPAAGGSAGGLCRHRAARTRRRRERNRRRPFARGALACAGRGLRRTAARSRAHRNFAARGARRSSCARTAAYVRSQRAHRDARGAGRGALATHQPAPGPGRELRDPAGATAAITAMAVRRSIEFSVSALRRLFLQRCFYLFVLLLTLITISPFMEGTRGGYLLAGFNAFIVLSAAATVGRTALSFLLVFVLIGAAVSLRFASQESGQAALFNYSLLLHIIVYLTVIGLLLRYVFGPEIMDADRLWGAAAVYLMIGILWCFIYAITDDPACKRRSWCAASRRSSHSSTCSTSASRR